MTATHSPLCPAGVEARDLPCDAPCAVRDRPAVLAATILASSMAFIDGTVVQVALPAIQSTLRASFADLQWIVNGYALMLGALLLAGGALGDQTGRRRVFIAGTALFALASIGCALAPSVASLVASRAVQGVGAALMVPQSLAIIAASFPREVRGPAIGTWAACSALTTTAGPVIGGLLVDSASWRAVFWINVPIAAAALLLTFRYVPESRSATREPIDRGGAVLATLGLGALTYALTAWPKVANGMGAAGAVLTALAVGIVAAGAFVWVERHTAAPLLPPALLRRREFAGLNVMTVLLYAAVGGTLFLLPYNLIQVQSYTAAGAGLALLPFGLVIGLMSRYAGKLSDRVGPRPALIAGPALVAVGSAALASPGVGGSYAATFLIPILLISVGMGIAVSPLTTAVMNAAPDEQSGTASGINNAASRVAGLVAVAVVGALATAVFAGALETGIGALALEPAVGSQVIGNAGQLAELSVPASVPPDVRPALEHTIDAAFVRAFRAGVLFDAVLAALAAATAVIALRPAEWQRG